MHPLGPGYRALHCDWLWLSVTVSVCHKEKFPEDLEVGACDEGDHLTFVFLSLD